MPTSSPPSTSLGDAIAKGVIWMALLKFSIRALALISLTVLARLLTPDDIGVVAMAMFVYAVLDSMAWFGFDTALIQKRQVDDGHFYTAFTFNVIVYSTIAVLLVALAVPAARYYQDPRVENIIYALAVGAFLVGFENTGIIKFRKNLQYHKEFYFMVSIKLISFSVTIPLAFLLRNYWALVIGALAGRVGGVVVSYIMSPFRPRFSLQKTSELFNFSKWMFLNSLFFSLRNRIAEPIIGRLSGSASVGNFNMAYEISNLPTTELVAPINRAVFPGYAKVSNDFSRLRRGYLMVVGMIALLALPAAAGIAVVADLLVPLWLGEKWLNTIPLMKLLAWSGALTALVGNTGSVFLAVGKPKTLAMLSGASFIVLLALVVPLAQQYGPVGVAWAYIITVLIINPLQYAMMFRLIDMSVSQFIQVIWRPAIATLTMYGSVYVLINGYLLPHNLTSFGALAVAIAVGAVFYLVVSVILWRLSGSPDGAENYLLTHVWPALRRRLSL